MTTTQSTLTTSDLKQFTCDLARYRHPLNAKVIYTPGVQYVAEQAYAYWLIDAIVSYFDSPLMKRAMTQDARIADLHFWRLDVADSTALLTARADEDDVPFIRQEITYTDFPLDHLDIWAGFDGRYWTLYLPSEH